LQKMIDHPYYKVVAVFLLTMMVAGACSTGTAPEATVSSARAQSVQSSTSEINRALVTLATNTSTIPGDYRIGPEDLLQITLYNVAGDTSLTANADARLTPRTAIVRVSQQGLLSLPLVGEIKASGMTVSELESTLRKKYEKYIYQPEVGVLVTEYKQRVSVIGAAVKTGIFELTGPKTVIDIVAMAGGVTEKAGTQVHIYRQGPNGRETHVIDLLALASNASMINAENAGLITMPVQAGDVINILPAGTFFVDGAVKNPGPYHLGRRYSLSQALATAGGVDRDLYSSDVTILRRGTSGAEPINIDLNKVVAGSSSDPQIEADDVILVPIHTVKYVYFKIFGQILGWGTSVAGAAGS
jgi:polysaccharide export outer membrane protein